MSLKLSVGCNCCQPVPCCECDPVFPSSLYTGDFDLTLSGFFNSFECGYCEFLENTFTLECLGGLSGTCFDLPEYVDHDDTPCNWGILFTGDVDDRSCVIEEDSTILTGYTLSRTITWTNLILRRFKIDNGVDDPYPFWRIQMGYVMTTEIFTIIYDADGNPIRRGLKAEKCDEFYYDFTQSGAFPATCILDSGDTWIKTEPAPLSVTYPPFGFPQETLTVQLSDFCSSVGTASVEAVLV